jgi:hypothetical protein
MDVGDGRLGDLHLSSGWVCGDGEWLVGNLLIDPWATLAPRRQPIALGTPTDLGRLRPIADLVRFRHGPTFDGRGPGFQIVCKCGSLQVDASGAVSLEAWRDRAALGVLLECHRCEAVYALRSDLTTVVLQEGATCASLDRRHDSMTWPTRQAG